ncbi:oxidoreductase [Candidatus Bathyarchaeota archaeon]|nr:oxidoreductase [Candidatus Bathyarchaeota archaeon]
MRKTRLATVWLSGCSGCHMSFLDQDERIIELSEKVELVYSPLVDVKDFPENVDLTLIEGAVGNEHQLDLLKRVRERSKIIVSLGDCAVTANVSGLRNAWIESEAALKRAYLENVDIMPGIPTDVPKLLKKAYPLHEAVKVDYYIPGCPPSADLINYILMELLSGGTPNMEGKSKYG